MIGLVCGSLLTRLPGPGAFPFPSMRTSRFVRSALSTRVLAKLPFLVSGESTLLRGPPRHGGRRDECGAGCLGATPADARTLPQVTCATGLESDSRDMRVASRHRRNELRRDPFYWSD